VLLQVCTADTPGKDAGSILQRVVPLTTFLEKSRDKVRDGPGLHMYYQARQRPLAGRDTVQRITPNISCCLGCSI
jgi:hypothetical protein